MALISIENVFTLAAWLFFLVQLGNITYNTLHHPEMSTVLTTKQLFPGNFPLKLQVCVKPGLDEDKLRSYGYTSKDFPPFLAYLYGFNNLSGTSMVGWAGLDASSGSQDPTGNN